MIAQPTVFVLGAGASEPYGFPTGATLADLVCARLSEGRNSAFRVALRGEYRVAEPPQFDSFVQAFRRSGCATLDEFVQAQGNRVFLPPIKASIVEVLIGHERPEKLLPDTPEQRNRKTAQLPLRDWCGYLFDHMRTPNEENFHLNRVKVITFNFDRSFEFQLFERIQGSYGLSTAEASKLCAVVPVLHIHGSLGGPSWLGERRPESRDYTPVASRDQKRELLQAIRIVHEEIEPRSLTTAHEWLSAAHTICFLGFGYHSVNLGRLRMNETYPAATIWGTTLGLTDVERARIERSFGNNGVSLRLNFPLPVRDFLRAAAVLQTERG